MAIIKVSDLPQKATLDSDDKIVGYSEKTGGTSLLLGQAFKDLQTAAEASASAAASSASAAAKSQSTTEEIANDAKSALTAQKTDALDAINSAKTTGVSAVQSAQKTAESSINSASSSATNAIASDKEAALTEMNAVKSSVAGSTETAKAQADLATQKASAAATSATNAASSESSARSSASTATTKASEASASASAAASSASAAASSQRAAASSASDAASSASAAAESAATVDAKGEEQKNRVTAEGDKQVKRLQDAINDGLTLTGAERAWTLQADVAAGAAITIPDNVTYVVGWHYLRVSWNGLVLYPGENFNEIGEADARSQTFSLTFPAKTGDVLDVWVGTLVKGDVADLSRRVAYIDQEGAEE